jgi:hypothetical protein
MDVGGVFYQHPYASDCPTPTNAATCGRAATGTVLGAPLQKLQVNLFSDTHTDDKFSNTALSVNGKVGALDLVYSGAYLTRKIADDWFFKWVQVGLLAISVKLIVDVIRA